MYIVSWRWDRFRNLTVKKEREREVKLTKREEIEVDISITIYKQRQAIDDWEFENQYC